MESTLCIKLVRRLQPKLCQHVPAHILELLGSDHNSWLVREMPRPECVSLDF